MEVRTAIISHKNLLHWGIVNSPKDNCHLQSQLLLGKFHIHIYFQKKRFPRNMPSNEGGITPGKI